jgi:hypothetical protein
MIAIANFAVCRAFLAVGEAIALVKWQNLGESQTRKLFA